MRTRDCRPWWWWINPWLYIRRRDRAYDEALEIIREQSMEQYRGADCVRGIEAEDLVLEGPVTREALHLVVRAITAGMESFESIRVLLNDPRSVTGDGFVAIRSECEKREQEMLIAFTQVQYFFRVMDRADAPPEAKA